MAKKKRRAFVQTTNLFPYKGKPPFVAGSDTSEGASVRVAGSANTMRKKIFDHIQSVNDATCDEVEVVLRMPHQTASARIRELVLMGLLRDTGERRETRSGSMARVYVIGRGK